jgi:hypothetical protein
MLITHGHLPLAVCEHENPGPGLFEVGPKDWTRKESFLAARV